MSAVDHRRRVWRRASAWSSVGCVTASESKREAIEVAARPLRELLREEHDEIAAAQRALRQAEKAHDRAIELAEQQLRAA